MDPITGTPNDPTVAYTPLELNGKKYQMVFNLAALAKAQAATKVNFLHGIDFDSLDPEKYTALLQAGLSKMHPELTVEHVADMIDMRDFRRVAKAVAYAFGANQMEPESENPPSPAPAE